MLKRNETVRQASPFTRIDSFFSRLKQAKIVTFRYKRVRSPYPYLAMALLKLTINNQIHPVDVDPDMPLLWAIRDVVGLTGTKFGCGIAQCGACTVHLDGSAIRSCSFPVSAAAGHKITTIEGLSKNADHPLQKAWVEHQVPQCGYCQSGQIMSAAALLKQTPKPTDDDIDSAMQGNICRCGTYNRIRQAIHTASSEMASGPKLPKSTPRIGKR